MDEPERVTIHVADLGWHDPAAVYAVDLELHPDGSVRWLSATRNDQSKVTPDS